MIQASIKDAERYYALHPLFQELFEYVRTHDLLHAPAGRISLRGDELFINVNDSQMKTAEEQKLEVHRRYIDVHFPLSCKETWGWRDLATIEEESDAPFDETNDYAVYSVPASAYITANPGEFFVTFPEDAHAPVIGEGKIRKLVAKVLL